MEARDLWLMEKAAFNAWRQANDLPGLLSFFRQSLPHFSEWLNQYGITDAEFLGLDHTSHFFLGDGPMYLTDATEPAEPGAATRGRGLFVADVPADQLVARVPPGHLFNIRSSKRFLPYWHWLKTQRHVHLFRIPRAGNNAVTDDLVYMSWRSVPRLREPGAGGHAFDSTAYLFYDHEVLKMGGVRISPNQLDDRNLDFVNLDGLEVVGPGWARTTEVAYSSCNQIRLVKTNKAFLTFVRCQLEYFRVENSRLQDLHFVECGLMAPRFTNSRLFRMSFQRSVPGEMNLENCELVDLYFEAAPKDKMPFAARSDALKRFRVAFQQRGNRGEASHYYYLERLSEFLSHLSPFFSEGAPPGLPRRAYFGTYADRFERFRLGQYPNATRRWQLLFGNIPYYLKLIFFPPYLIRFVRRKLRVIPPAFDFFLWGFGERPSRVFVWMALVILAFAARYYFGSCKALHGNLLESLYCSAFNFATIGCNYKSSFDSIEGILGAALLGLMVAGFANRARY